MNSGATRDKYYPFLAIGYPSQQYRWGLDVRLRKLLKTKRIVYTSAVFPRNQKHKKMPEYLLDCPPKLTESIIQLVERANNDMKTVLKYQRRAVAERTGNKDSTVCADDITQAFLLLVEDMGGEKALRSLSSAQVHGIDTADKQDARRDPVPLNHPPTHSADVTHPTRRVEPAIPLERERRRYSAIPQNIIQSPPAKARKADTSGNSPAPATVREEPVTVPATPAGTSYTWTMKVNIEHTREVHEWNGQRVQGRSQTVRSRYSTSGSIGGM
jgi:hypothetical protein